jgi:large conductance mechanosensitive channel
VAGLTLALGLWTLVQAVVSYLIAPLISVFIGNAETFQLNAFTINGREFRYGAVIEAALDLILIAALFTSSSSCLGGAAPAHRREPERCPECTSSISAAARRCPHCTAVIQPDAA